MVGWREGTGLEREAPGSSAPDDGPVRLGGGIGPSLITNGWLLPRKFESLLDAGFGALLVSINSHSIDSHEKNRGLRGVGERIRQGVATARSRGLPTMAVVTVNRLVDFEQLPTLLDDLGFDAVSFSYPRREPFGSTSLVYSEESKLIDFDEDELLHCYEAIEKLKRRIVVESPALALAEMKRQVRGEEELFPCVGGYKYFYLDWNLDIWRCETWPDCRHRRLNVPGAGAGAPGRGDALPADRGAVDRRANRGGQVYSAVGAAPRPEAETRRRAGPGGAGPYPQRRAVPLHRFRERWITLGHAGRHVLFGQADHAVQLQGDLRNGRKAGLLPALTIGLRF